MVPTDTGTPNRVIPKLSGLAAIYNALVWLSQNGLADHIVERLDGYPVLRVHSSRDVLSTFSLLGIEEVSDDPLKPTFFEKYGNPSFTKRFTGDHAVGFNYVDRRTPFQPDTITKLFTTKFGSSQGLHHVRSDKEDGTGHSIDEKVTNLIAAKYFTSRGYMVREDRGQGPDLIAFKTDLVADMVRRGVVRRGATVSEIGAARAFGRVQNENVAANLPDEIICVETESTNFKNGVKQLKEGYDDTRREFASVDFFDRRVLAVPFLDEIIDDLDVLTYDSKFQFIPAKTNQLSGTIQQRKKSFITGYLDSIIKKMLLSNLRLDELIDLVAPKPKSVFELLEGIEAIDARKALNAVDSILQSESDLIHPRQEKGP